MEKESIFNIRITPAGSTTFEDAVGTLDYPGVDLAASLPMLFRGKDGVHLSFPYQPHIRGALVRVAGHRRPVWQPELKAWRVPKTRVHHARDWMLWHFGEVVDAHSVSANTAAPCDRRCYEAEGYECECPCWGENHGVVAYADRGGVLVARTVIKASMNSGYVLKHYKA